MIVVDTIGKLHAFLAAARAEGQSVGLVPTMGALSIQRSLMIRVTLNAIRAPWRLIVACWRRWGPVACLPPLLRKFIPSPIPGCLTFPPWIK